MKTKERLQTTLDRLPYGPEGMPEDQKVSKKLPEGVRSRELYEDIVRIAGPSFVELLLTQLTSMVDLMMVGSMGGTENLEMGTQALAAVGLTTQPKFLLMAAFVSMNTGVTALVARNRGRGDQEKANLVVRQGLLFTFWATVLMSILGVVFARPMVIFMGSTEETVTIWATQYLQIQMAGFLTMALTSTITASLRAVGDSKTCMIYNMIANGVNVCFNWLLIYGNLGFPALGVAGASIATVIGQSLGKRRYDMAQAYTSRTRTVGFLFSLILAAIFVLFGGNIVGLYNSNPEIIRIGGHIMLIVAFLQPFQSSQFIVAGGLRGAGDTRTTAMITFVTVLLVRPVFAIILIRMGLGLYGAWYALAADQLLRSALVLARYQSGKWKTIRLRNEV